MQLINKLSPLFTVLTTLKHCVINSEIIAETSTDHAAVPIVVFVTLPAFSTISPTSVLSSPSSWVLGLQKTLRLETDLVQHPHTRMQLSNAPAEAERLSVIIVTRAMHPQQLRCTTHTHFPTGCTR